MQAFYDMTEHCCSLRSSVTGRGGIARFPSGGINFTGGRSTRCKRPPDRVAYHSEADHQTESSVMHMGWPSTFKGVTLFILKSDWLCCLDAKQIYFIGWIYPGHKSNVNEQHRNGWRVRHAGKLQTFNWNRDGISRREKKQRVPEFESWKISKATCLKVTCHTILVPKEKIIKQAQKLVQVDALEIFCNTL